MLAPGALEHSSFNTENNRVGQVAFQDRFSHHAAGGAPNTPGRSTESRLGSTCASDTTACSSTNTRASSALNKLYLRSNFSFECKLKQYYYLGHPGNSLFIGWRTLHSHGHCTKHNYNAHFACAQLESIGVSVILMQLSQ